MKSITLHTACASNAGTRIAAGADVTVGSQPDQIDAARAKALVEGGSAVITGGNVKADTAEDAGK